MPPGAEGVTVASITDGDTLDVRADDGSVFEVRIIGTNTPERGECFADEAARVLAALVPPGSRIGMTSDVSDIDQFDRLLRYLWFDQRGDGSPGGCPFEELSSGHCDDRTVR
jgi:endonuclease YncB( thermonuclease family)